MSKSKPIKRSPSPVFFKHHEEQSVQPLHRFARKTEGAKTYSEKLKDPRWQRKRLEVFQRDRFTCVDCGATTVTLHVHHNNGYRKGLEPWDYPNAEMETLCENCHKAEHRFKKIGCCPKFYGYIIAIEIEWPSRLIATFEYNGEVTKWLVPDLDLFTLLNSYLLKDAACLKQGSDC